MQPLEDDVPESFGRYEALFRIAAGGMAEVYAARLRGEGGFQKLLALKRMLPNLAEDEQFVTMFLDEARLASNISSPHVVSTLDLGRASDGSLYIIMDLVLGVTLSQILRTAARESVMIPVGVGVELVGQAAQGLHDAHEATTPMGQPLGIVHRDVSPQNVLVGLDGRVRITDFGVARAILRLSQTTTGQLKGKFAYFAPEQIKGGALIDRRADIFALGIVAWEVLTGRRLFASDNPMATMDLVRSMPIPSVMELNPEVTPEIDAVVMAALERDPDRRVKTAGEFAHKLRNAARRSIELPQSDVIAKYVKETGGEQLSKLTRSIKRALSHQETATDIHLDPNDLIDLDEPTPEGEKANRSGIVESQAGRVANLKTAVKRPAGVSIREPGSQPSQPSQPSSPSVPGHPKYAMQASQPAFVGPSPGQGSHPSWVGTPSAATPILGTDTPAPSGSGKIIGVAVGGLVIAALLGTGVAFWSSQNDDVRSIDLQPAAPPPAGVGLLGNAPSANAIDPLPGAGLPVADPSVAQAPAAVQQPEPAADEPTGGSTPSSGRRIRRGGRPERGSSGGSQPPTAAQQQQTQVATPPARPDPTPTPPREEPVAREQPRDQPREQPVVRRPTNPTTPTPPVPTTPPRRTGGLQGVDAFDNWTKRQGSGSPR